MGIKEGCKVGVGLPSQFLRWVIFPVFHNCQTLVICCILCSHVSQFVDDIFKCIFFLEKVLCGHSYSCRRLFPEDPIDNYINESSLVKLLAWRLIGNEPLRGSVMTCSLTHLHNTGLLFVTWINFNPIHRMERSSHAQYKCVMKLPTHSQTANGCTVDIWDG